MEELILPWVQAKKEKPFDPEIWFVPYPEDGLQARPLILLQFVPEKKYQQNSWQATILNLFIVEIPHNIWDAEKAKHLAEQQYLIALDTLKGTVPHNCMCHRD